MSARISPETAATLRQLRGLPVMPSSEHATPTKRPVGGRPNPCAMHEVPPWRPIVVGKKARPKNAQHWTSGPRKEDRADRIAQAVVAGELAVGVELTPRQVAKAIGEDEPRNLLRLCEILTARNAPVRMRSRAYGRNTRRYVIEIR